MPKLTFLPELGIKIILRPQRCSAIYIGTRAQLEDEGFHPEGDTWPAKPHSRTVHIKRDERTYYLRCLLVNAPDGTTLYRVESWIFGLRAKNHAVHLKLQEALEIANQGNAACYARCQAELQARDDKPFQDFKRALLGQKKRGRKPTTIAQAATQGANHV